MRSAERIESSRRKVCSGVRRVTFVSSKSLPYDLRASERQKIVYQNFQDAQAVDLDFSHRRQGQGWVGIRPETSFTKNLLHSLVYKKLGFFEGRANIITHRAAFLESTSMRNFIFEFLH